MECDPASAKILIATSDGYLISEYRSALLDARFHVSTASGGIECLEEIRAFKPHLIVLDADILWGGADGVLAVLAEDPAYPTLPAMVVGSRRSRSTLYQVGKFIVSDYLLKPLTGKQLARRIELLFDSFSKMSSQASDGAISFALAGKSPVQ